MDYEQPLVRVPLESLRHTFKHARILVEKDLNVLLNAIEHSDPSQRPELAQRVASLEKRLATLQNEHEKSAAKILKRARYIKRITKAMANPTGPDHREAVVEHLNLKIADHLLRCGHAESVRRLVAATGIEDLVDAEIMHLLVEIRASLAKRQPFRVLQWCAENRQTLRKLCNPLEFSIRHVQYLELVNSGKQLDAIAFARKYFSKHTNLHLPELSEAALALVVYTNGVPAELEKKPEPLDAVIARHWSQLDELFTTTFLEINGKNPHVPLLEVVCAGLSALRTRVCHPPGKAVPRVVPNTERVPDFALSGAIDPEMRFQTTARVADLLESVRFAMLRARGQGQEVREQSHDATDVEREAEERGREAEARGREVDMETVTEAEAATATEAQTQTATERNLLDPFGRAALCPACSKELGELAASVPHAHHVRSILDPDPMALPTMRIYGLGKLIEYAKQHGVWPRVMDPRSGELFDLKDLRKVFPT